MVHFICVRVFIYGLLQFLWRYGWIFKSEERNRQKILILLEKIKQKNSKKNFSSKKNSKRKKNYR